MFHEPGLYFFDNINFITWLKTGEVFLSSVDTFIGQKSLVHVDVIVCFVNIFKCLVNKEYSSP